MPTSKLSPLTRFLLTGGRPAQCDNTLSYTDQCVITLSFEAEPSILIPGVCECDNLSKGRAQPARTPEGARSNSNSNYSRASAIQEAWIALTFFA